MYTIYNLYLSYYLRYIKIIFVLRILNGDVYTYFSTSHAFLYLRTFYKYIKIHKQFSYKYKKKKKKKSNYIKWRLSKTKEGKRSRRKQFSTTVRRTCATGCNRQKKSVITGGSASRQVDQFLFLLFFFFISLGRCMFSHCFRERYTQYLTGCTFEVLVFLFFFLYTYIGNSIRDFKADGCQHGERGNIDSEEIPAAIIDATIASLLFHCG